MILPLKGIMSGLPPPVRFDISREQDSKALTSREERKEQSEAQGEEGRWKGLGKGARSPKGL